MNYRSFNLEDWIGHISGAIEDERELDGNEMRDLVEFLSTLKQEPVLDKIRAEIKQVADAEQKYDETWAIGLRYAVDIIDKYKAESGVSDG